MELLDQEYRMLPVTSLRPHEDNPNIGDRDALANSVDQNGFYGAVLVREHPDENGAFQILGGEHRWRLACERAQAEIPAFVLRDVDDVKAIRILIDDNEVTRRGRYDKDTLDRVLESLGSVTGTAFDGALQSAAAELDEEQEEERRARGEDEQAEDSYSDDSDDESSFDKEYGVLVTADSELEQQQIFEYLASTYGVTRLRVVSV